MKSASGERVLCLNAGSSSLKFALWELAADGAPNRRLARGGIDRIGSDAHIQIDREAQKICDRHVDLADLNDAGDTLFEFLQGSSLPLPTSVGHRIVHGGLRFREPIELDDCVRRELDKLAPLAPLHMPGALAVVDAAVAQYAEVPHVLCFDTSFHTALPEVAKRLPLPRHLFDEGIRRYGFHGLSFESVLKSLPEIRTGRTIIAHLGGGASLAALMDGRPLDTTMGFSPTGGILMGTRSGDLDPGLLIHLQLHRGYDIQAIERLVNRESGLLGISGLSSDVQLLSERSAGDAHANQALEHFGYAIRKEIGAYAAALGGVDRLVFTGGIGEHSSLVRAIACAGLAFLGIDLDEAANEAHRPSISRPESRCAVYLVATDEERVIARHAGTILSAKISREKNRRHAT